MIQILAKTKKEMYSPDNTYNAEAKLEEIDKLLAKAPNQNEVINLQFERARVLLEYGDEAQSVAIYEQLVKLNLPLPPDMKNELFMALGTAYLRLAERNNCVMAHNAESCIMPVQGTGVHQDKTAARKAAETFEAVVNADPKNLDARWLLNIARMTIGDYPKNVSPQWLIPGLDAPDYPVQPFVDLAEDVGIAVRNRSGGSIVEDFDNDGFLDIVISAWALDDPMHFFKNNGDGTFTDRSHPSGLAQFVGGLNMTSTDYNNDGFMDIFVLRGAWQGQTGFGKQPNSLLRNNGDGTFTDVTTTAGLLSFHPTQTATWNDFNRDGWLDLFIGNESANAKDQHPCELYINNKNGTFTEVAKQTKMNIIAFVKGVASGDYDNDGWPDLFLSTINGQKYLFRNKGVAANLPAFENTSALSGFDKETSSTFPTWFFDYDNDGFLDLFTCNYDFNRPLSYYAAKEALQPSNDRTGKPYLFHNNGNGTFTNVTAQMGVNKTAFAMGSNFGDVDNDGFLDIYLATGNPHYMSLVPNKLFKNLGGQKFADATISSRLGNLQKGHGVSFADLDNDGDQDIHADMGGALRGDTYPNSLYLNPGEPANNWICLKLEGVQTNRAAIGTKVTLKFRENGQQRMVYREVNSGGSFGCSPLRREIGIGKAAVIDEIVVQWPVSGKTTVLKNVKPNQFLRLREDKDEAEPMPQQKLVFKKRDGTIPMCAPVKAK